MFSSLSSLALLVAAAAAASQPSQPSVTIQNGTLHGGACSASEGKADFFKGIPYAQAPTGSLRFAAPQRYNSQFHTRDATSSAHSCVQFGASNSNSQSEDCLYLDVWRPTNAASNAQLPVRVWLYNGEAEAGYDGCEVAASGAVHVSLNYRSGPLGFMTLEGAGLDGNQAMQDIQQGLEWVRENIGHFGGDADRVLLHGQSSSAVDAFTFATLPQSEGLIHAVATQSGGGRTAPLKSAAQALGASFASTLGCKDNDLSCMRSKSLQDLNNAYAHNELLNSKALPHVAITNPTSNTFAPCVDGQVVPQQPAEVGVRVPAIIGTTADEGTLFTLQQYGNNEPSETDYAKFIEENFGTGSEAVSVAKQYPLKHFKAGKLQSFYAISQVITDAAFVCPAQRALNMAATRKVPVWTYRFGLTPSCAWSSRTPQNELATLEGTHTAELPYVFGVTSALPRPQGSCNMNDNEKKLASFLNGAWSAMAKDQKPCGSDQWPAYSSQHSEGVLIQDSAMPQSLDFSACDFWNKLDSQQSQQAGNKASVTPESTSSSQTSNSKTSSKSSTSSTTTTTKHTTTIVNSKGTSTSTSTSTSSGNKPTTTSASTSTSTSSGNKPTTTSASTSTQSSSSGKSMTTSTTGSASFSAPSSSSGSSSTTGGAVANAVSSGAPSASAGAPSNSTGHNMTDVAKNEGSGSGSASAAARTWALVIVLSGGMMFL